MEVLGRQSLLNMPNQLPHPPVNRRLSLELMHDSVMRSAHAPRLATPRTRPIERGGGLAPLLPILVPIYARPYLAVRERGTARKRERGGEREREREREGGRETVSPRGTRKQRMKWSTCFRVEGLGFGFQDLGSRVWNLGFRV